MTKRKTSMEQLFQKCIPLSAEAERKLARQWQDNQDVLALQDIVLAHGRLAISMAREYTRFGLAISDLEQEACLGLLEAAYRFDPNKGARFSTYAAFWIRSSLQKYALSNWSIVRPAATNAQKASFFNLSAQKAPDDSLNLPVGRTGKSMGDLLPDKAPTPEESYAHQESLMKSSIQLKKAIKNLAPREQEIIHLRHHSEKAPTFSSIGASWGVSKERARQIESSAMNKLRRYFKAKTMVDWSESA